MQDDEKKDHSPALSLGSQITPFLMFNDQAQEAAKFYTAIFKNSKILHSDTVSASFILNGQKFMAYNGGPHFNFSEGISLYVSCKDQDEVDYYWEKLLAGGGAESQCGWLKDRFGVCWQIIPDILTELIGSSDRAKAGRAVQAMLKMKKIDAGKLQKAYNGEIM